MRLNCDKTRRQSNVLGNFAVNASFILVDTLGAAFVKVNQLLVVHTQEMKNCAVKIMHMQSILDSMQANFIRCTIDLTASNTATGKPHREAGWIVIASIAFFTLRRPTELATPDH